MKKLILTFILMGFSFSYTQQTHAQTPPPPECPPGQHWDSNLEECVHDSVNPGQCPSGQHWDSGMNMCMPDQTSKHNLMFHMNQYLAGIDSSGPRGRNAISAPNMWMLDYNYHISDRYELECAWMGTSDLWTVPKNGTPELLQTGEVDKNGKPFIDAQHPHSSPIMGLNCKMIRNLNSDGTKKLSFMFAPRGEATAGPQAFMHRASAEGNLDAPLAHHLQDVFHITSTVIGTELKIKNTTLEASIFSGAEPSPTIVNLDTHRPDSYAFRLNQELNDKLSFGGSFARVQGVHHETGESQIEHEDYYSAWIQNNLQFKKSQFHNSLIFGQVRNRDNNTVLNSFLEEFVYQLAKNKFFGRVEVLQRTPEQLQIKISDPTGARWVKAYTVGYERTLKSTADHDMYLGTSVTKDVLPADLQPSYGGNPKTARVFLRFNWRRNKSWDN